MTLAVLGIDALDPELVDPDSHSNLVLNHWKGIETISSAQGSPSTHEIWPSIITGLTPEEHGLMLDEGVSWSHPLLDIGSSVADWVLPGSLQSQIGDWLLNTMDVDTFRTPAEYYQQHGLRTIFDDRKFKAIGIPNYVTDPEAEDREHTLRRNLGELFKRDSEAKGGHTSSDPRYFFELCIEMALVRIARVRSAIRSQYYELVFGYTSALDLIGHVTYDQPSLHRRAYSDIDDFVSELLADLNSGDELMIVSDHGLQNGIHTDTAMIAGTNADLVSDVTSVLDVYDAITNELDGDRHVPKSRNDVAVNETGSSDVEEHLQDLGYLD